MSSALTSALSGLRVHQFYLDVVGNNIANSSTVGYQSSRVTFSDVLSQTLRAGSGPTSTLGGVNPVQNQSDPDQHTRLGERREELLVQRVGLGVTVQIPGDSIDSLLAKDALPLGAVEVGEDEQVPSGDLLEHLG